MRISDADALALSANAGALPLEGGQGTMGRAGQPMW